MLSKALMGKLMEDYFNVQSGFYEPLYKKNARNTSFLIRESVLEIMIFFPF